MTNTLKITGYVGGRYEDVVEYVRREGGAALQDAVAASETRIARFERREAGTGAVRIDAFDAAHSARLTLRTDAARDLDGASVTLAPVGHHTGLTELVVTLAEPFGTDRTGSRQFLAASTFVAESTTGLTDELTRAA